MKKVLILSLALILLLGITSRGTSAFFSDTETSTGNQFTAWVEEVVCTCEKFNVSDKPDAKIYKYNASGTPVDSFGLSGDNGFPTGVAAVGTNVYVIDHARKQVYKYDCCGTLEDVSKKLLKAVGPSSVGNIDGLAIYGTEMWVLSGNDKNIYRYPLGTAFSGPGDINAAQKITLDTDNKGAAGLAIDSNYLYVVDYSTSTPKETRFYQYPHPGGTPVTVSKVLLEYTTNNKLQSPAGAMLDGTSLWVVDDGTDKMYEYDITNLFDGVGIEENATSEFALDGNNADATGV
ncbi:MAG: hypothetical protein IMY77_04210 [Chloroflexi bacterium]|nr:hypothetical protein [Chloroflexota bacterium]